MIMACSCVRGRGTASGRSPDGFSMSPTPPLTPPHTPTYVPAGRGVCLILTFTTSLLDAAAISR